MISKFDLAKALLTQAELISDSNFYTVEGVDIYYKLVRNGESYEPDPNTLYVQEFVLYGPDNARGMSDSSCDAQFGIYQLTINIPKSLKGSKWLGLEVVGNYQAGFGRGTELFFNDQKVRMRNSALKPMDSNDTHDIHVLSINYSVIN